ncbi:MAG: hypothetical protein V7750_06485 [Sneathiella sp.]
MMIETSIPPAMPAAKKEIVSLYSIRIMDAVAAKIKKMKATKTKRFLISVSNFASLKSIIKVYNFQYFKV